MQKRILGWLILGSLIGLAMAGALLMVIHPVHLDTSKVGLAMLGAGTAGLVLWLMWTTRRRRRSRQAPLEAVGGRGIGDAYQQELEE